MQHELDVYGMQGGTIRRGSGFSVRSLSSILRICAISALACLAFRLASPLELTAQISSPTVDSGRGVDSVMLADSIARADSIRRAADTVQPELRLGVQGGFVTTSASVHDIDLEPENRSGFHAGVRAEMEFVYPVFFLIELEYAQRGLRSSYTTQSGFDVQEEYRFNYLDLPILYRAEIPIAEKHALSLAFGVNLGFVLTRSQVTTIENVDTVRSLDASIENFDYGLEGRIGWTFSATPKVRLYTDLRYLHGLQNILILASLNDDRSWKSRSIFASLGVTYQLQRSIRR